MLIISKYWPASQYIDFPRLIFLPISVAGIFIIDTNHNVRFVAIWIRFISRLLSGWTIFGTQMELDDNT